MFFDKLSEHLQVEAKVLDRAEKIAACLDDSD
jgi:hypothetical protein